MPAAVPLELMLPHLQFGMGVLSNCTPATKDAVTDILRGLLDSTTAALVMLMDVVGKQQEQELEQEEQEPPALPARCLAVLRATQLKPALLLRYFSVAAEAADAGSDHEAATAPAAAPTRGPTHAQ